MRAKHATLLTLNAEESQDDQRIETEPESKASPSQTNLILTNQLKSERSMHGTQRSIKEVSDEEQSQDSMKNLKSAISCEMYLRENEHLMLARSPSFGKKDANSRQQMHENNYLGTESHDVVNMLNTSNI